MLATQTKIKWCCVNVSSLNCFPFRASTHWNAFHSSQRDDCRVEVPTSAIWMRVYIRFSDNDVVEYLVMKSRAAAVYALTQSPTKAAICMAMCAMRTNQLIFGIHILGPFPSWHRTSLNDCPHTFGLVCIWLRVERRAANAIRLLICHCEPSPQQRWPPQWPSNVELAPSSPMVHRAASIVRHPASIMRRSSST